MIRCKVLRKSYLARTPGAIEEMIDPTDSGVDPYITIDETKMRPGDNLQPVDQHGNPVDIGGAKTLHPAVVQVSAPAAPAPAAPAAAAATPAPAATVPPPPAPPPPPSAPRSNRRGRPPGTRNKSR